jgi:hypothetical protein
MSWDPPKGVRVYLSSGDSFYVDASLEDVVAHLRLEQLGLLAQIGDRWVNPSQVAQLTVEQVPSVERAESLELV